MSTRLWTALVAVVVGGGPALGQFVDGNLIVYRVGTGTGVLTSAGTAAFLDQFTQAGAAGTSVALPTVVGGANGRLVASGIATSEGMLQLGGGGRFLTFTGYDADLGTASIAGTASTAVPRTVGLADPLQSVATQINTSTRLTDLSSGNNVRSAFTTTGTDLYAVGGAGGVRYATVGGTTSTQLAATPTNFRTVQVAGGQLYVSANTGTTRLATVGTGAPTTAGQTVTNLPGLPTTSPSSPYQFFFARIGNPAGFAGPNVLYYADDTNSAAGGILKYTTTDGTNWAASGSVPGGGGSAVNAARGLTGVVTGDNQVRLFAAADGNTLVGVTDGNAGGAAAFDAPAVLATAAADTALRGVAFAPTVLGWGGGTTTANSTWSLTNTNWVRFSSNFATGRTYSNAYTAYFFNLVSDRAVIVGPGISPPAIDVSNDSGEYTFRNADGSNGIQGLGTLTKTFPGSLRLTSPNTYSGGTAVNGGTLFIGSAFSAPTMTASATGPGPVTVNAGGTLGGAGGLVSGPVTVNPGGTVRPTLDVFKVPLAVGPTTFTPGSDLYITLALGRPTTAAANTGGSSGATLGQRNSALTTNGANSLTLNTPDVVLDLNRSLSFFDPGASYSYVVATGTNITPAGTGVPTQVAVGSLTILNDGVDVTGQFTGVGLFVSADSTRVFLNLTPVPEPATVLAVAAAGLGGARLLRRRQLV